MNKRVIHTPQYKQIFFVLCFVSVAAIAVYVYGIEKTVRNVVARQGIERELSSLSLRSGEDEFSYIAASNSIDMDKAIAMGFAPVKTQTFVSRTPDVALALSNAKN